MSEVSRRDFMALSGLAAGGAVWAGCAPTNDGRADTASSDEADQVVTNANVYTVDNVTPRAEAFAVKSGRFLAIGRNDEVSNLVGRGTEVIDAAGMAVFPGFIDAHNHPSSAGMRHLTQVDMNIRTIEGMKSALAEFRIGPIKTTIPLHRRLLETRAFVEHDFDIHYVERLLEQ